MLHLIKPARGDSEVPVVVADGAAVEPLMGEWKAMTSVFSMRRGAYKNCGVFSTQWEMMDRSCRGGQSLAGSTPGTGVPTEK